MGEPAIRTYKYSYCALKPCCEAFSRRCGRSSRVIALLAELLQRSDAGEGVIIGLFSEVSPVHTGDKR